MKTNTTITELKACPLCDGTPIIHECDDGNFIECESCSFQTSPYDDLDDAKKAWNWRSTQPQHQPCPLCGGNAEFTKDCGKYFIQCVECGAMGIVVDVDQECAAWMHWDRRPRTGI